MRKIDTTSGQRVPTKFSVGEVHLWNLRQRPIFVTDESYDSAKQMYAIDYDDNRQIEEAALTVRLFQLPRQAQLFHKEVSCYRREKRGFLVKPAGKFDLAMLALSDVPADFEHEAFQVRSGSSRWSIVHLYRSAKCGIIVDYSLNSASFLRNKFFQYVVHDLKIGTPRPKRGGASRPAWSKPPKHEAPAPLGSDRKLKSNEQREITECIAAAYRFLELNPKKASANAIQKAIGKTIDQIIANRKGPTAKLVTELSLNLGCLWGETVRRMLGWQWCYATVDGTEFFAIAARNRSHVIAPMHFIKEQLEIRRPADNTSLLLFNMLKANDLPEAEARQYVTIG